MTSESLAYEIVEAAAEIKAIDPIILDLRDLTSISDFFVIAHGRSDRQVQAMANKVMEQMAAKGIKPLGIEGYKTGHWILLDFGDVVAHFFYEETRAFYDLEGLWSDAPRLDLPDEIAQAL